MKMNNNEVTISTNSTHSKSEFIVFQLLPKGLRLLGNSPEKEVLSIKYSNNTNTWHIVEPDDIEHPIDKLFRCIKSLLHAKKRFEGTASDLIAKLKGIDGTLTISSNVMTRLFNEHSISLRKTYGIYYKRKRTADKRIITLSLLKEDGSMK